MATPSYTDSQVAASQLHLSRAGEWVYFRLGGVRYVRVPSGRSGKLYTVRADGNGCSCPFYVRTGGTCSHMLAVREREHELSLAAGLASMAETEAAFAGVQADAQARDAAWRVAGRRLLEEYGAD